MKWNRLVQLTADMQCFSTQFLFAGDDPRQIRLQLNRWSNEGRLIRITRGLYTLSDTYRKAPIEMPVIAQNLCRPSYVSLQSALSWYHMIPEIVPSTTSITTARPKRLDTPLGTFIFRHISAKYFHGFSHIELPSGTRTSFASPEKALLDLVYLTPGGDSMEYLRELRLQNLERIDTGNLRANADIFTSKKIERACQHIEELINNAGESAT